MGNIELADVPQPFEFQHFRNVRSQKDFHDVPLGSSSCVIVLQTATVFPAMLARSNSRRCAENQCHLVPRDEIVDLGQGRVARQEILPIATANVARSQAPCLHSNDADLHLSAESGVSTSYQKGWRDQANKVRMGSLLTVRRQRWQVTVTPSSVLHCT